MVDKGCGISSILPKPYEISQEGGITPKWRVIGFLTEVALELAIEERIVLDSSCHTPGKHWLTLSVRNYGESSSC